MKPVTMDVGLAAMRDQQLTARLSAFGIEKNILSKGSRCILTINAPGSRIKRQVLGFVNRADGSTLTFFCWPLTFGFPTMVGEVTTVIVTEMEWV